MGTLYARLNLVLTSKTTKFKTDPQNPIERNYSIIGNDILFQGREYDPTIALYNYRARYYDPMTGRFLQTDPMGYQDSMNLYQSFNSNPFDFVDPKGSVFVFKDQGKKYRNNSLYAIAAGSFSLNYGAPIFWGLLKSEIAIEIQNVDIILPGYNDFKRSVEMRKSSQEISENFNKVEWELGYVDFNEIKNRSKSITGTEEDASFDAIPVRISWSNIENLHRLNNSLKNRNGIGNVSGTSIRLPVDEITDIEGIIVMYHELHHVNAALNYTQSRISANYEASRGDLNRDAQIFGMHVYEDINTTEKKKQIKSRMQLILAKEAEYLNKKNSGNKL